MKKDKTKAKKGAGRTDSGIEFPNRQPQPQKKSRKEIRKQKNRNRAVTFILIMILLSICVFISLKVLFIVQKVDVVGTERYTRQEIVDFCAIPMEESIFRVEVEKLSEDIMDSFIYVDRVSVQKKLPNKVLITIEDAQPTYYLKTRGAESFYTVYSANFKALTTQSQRPEGLVEVDVDFTDRDSMELFKELVTALEENGYKDYTNLTVKVNGELEIVYDGRLKVDLGTRLDLGYKLRMAYYVMTGEIAKDAKGTVDASISGKVVYNIGA